MAMTVESGDVVAAISGAESGDVVAAVYSAAVEVASAESGDVVAAVSGAESGDVVAAMSSAAGEMTAEVASAESGDVVAAVSSAAAEVASAESGDVVAAVSSTAAEVTAEVASAESGDVVSSGAAEVTAEVASSESGDVVAAVSSAAAEVMGEVASSDVAVIAGGGAGVVAVTGGVAVSTVSTEISRRILSRFRARSDFLGSVWALGNHQTVRLIWAVVGVICGTLAPLYLVMSVHGLARVHALSDRGECYCFVQHVQHAAASAPGAADLMLVGGMVTGLIYWASYYCRSIRFFRAVERPWYFGPIGNGTVFVVSYYIAVAHRNTESAIIGFLLLAGVALAFIEIVRPVMDYGFLQTFLKMPLVITFAYYDGFRLTGWGFYVPCVLVVIYGTFVMPWFHSDRPARVRARVTRGRLELIIPRPLTHMHRGTGVDRTVQGLVL